MIIVSSLLLGFPCHPFSWLIFSTHLTQHSVKRWEEAHLHKGYTTLKDDSPCHLRPNRSVESEWVGTVRPFPKALMINENILEVCKHGFCCCCCFHLVGVFLWFWFFILHFGFAIMMVLEQCRTTMVGQSILAFFYPLLVSVIWQKAHLHTHRRHEEYGGAPVPQSEGQTAVRAVQKKFWLCRVAPQL